MLRYRLIFGPLLIAALIGALWLDEVLADRLGIPALVMLPMMFVVGVLGARELIVMLHRRNILVGPKLTSACVVLGMTASSFMPSELSGVSGVALVCSACVVTLLMAFVYYAVHQSAEGVAGAVSGTLLAFVYLGLMGGFLVVLRKEHSVWLVLGILLVTKSYDIGAYFTGRFFGRHKLILWLSPGKTWEGLAGGLLTSTAVAVLAVWACDALGINGRVAPGLEINLWQAGIIGLLFGLFGQGGDLVASLLKRDAGMKDASRTLPGFGGVLDVIDSPLVVAPVAYWAFYTLRVFSETQGA
ncbi:MAG: CDP-archaeol synthase [Phycisphaerales bacterium]